TARRSHRTWRSAASIRKKPVVKHAERQLRRAIDADDGKTSLQRAAEHDHFIGHDMRAAERSRSERKSRAGQISRAAQQQLRRKQRIAKNIRLPVEQINVSAVNHRSPRSNLKAKIKKTTVGAGAVRGNRLQTAPE